MKHLQKYQDLTKMPIIGTIITQPLHWTTNHETISIPSEVLDVVDIIPGTAGEPEIYIINKWYKPGIPQIIHKNMVEEWIPNSPSI